MFRVCNVYGVEYEDMSYGNAPIAETPDMSVQPVTPAPEIDRKALMEELKVKGIAFKPQMATDTLLKLLKASEEEL